MYQNKHSGSNIRTTDFTKEIVRRAATMLGVSEVKLIADLVENEYPIVSKKLKELNNENI